jgi:hypothetical protein
MGCFEEVAGRGVVTGKANGKVQVGKKRASILWSTLVRSNYAQFLLELSVLDPDLVRSATLT